MIEFLNKSCRYLDINRADKCNELFNEFFYIWSIIYSSDFFLPIVIVFFINLYLIFRQEISLLNKRQSYFQIIFLTILLCLIILNFRTNIPWVDDWEWLENLQTKEISIWKWLNQPTNIHNIFFAKLIFLFVDNYLNQNVEFFNFFSVFLILLISLIILSNENKISNLGISLIVIIIFSGKQFANFTQSCNIVWSLSFLYTILLYKFINGQNIKSKIINISNISIAPLTFGFGYVVPLYIIFFIYFHNIHKNLKILYIFLGILSISFSLFFPKLLFSDTSSFLSSGNYINLDLIVNYKFYLTYFGVLANIYLPWIDGFAYIGFIIGIIQFSIVFYFLIKIFKTRSNKELTNFITCNILIILGLIFALIVSIARHDLQTVVAARYSVGSILFQIGFWKLIFENCKFNMIFNKFTVILLTFYIFSLGMLSPYHGIHWQAKRYIENNKILKCYKSENDIKKCNIIAYKTLFFDGTWYDFNTFEKQIYILKRDKKSFFNF